MPEAPNAVRELAEDATSRKKFLRQAGGTGVAASLAAFIAACGATRRPRRMKSTPAATATAMGKSGTEQFGEGDLGIANYALTLEYLEADFYAQGRQQRHAQGQGGSTRAALVRRRGAGARRRADRADQEGGRQARLEAEGDVPARLREVRS